MRSGTHHRGAVRLSNRNMWVVVAGLLLALGDTAARATLTFATPVTARASSQFDALDTYGPTKLFDGNISAADLGTTNNLGGQYASSGTGNGVFADNDFNPVVSMDFASPVSANSIVYAQRTGEGGAAADKVDSIYIWFTQSSFNPTLGTGNPADNPTPPGAPQEIVTITHRSDSRLVEYAFPDARTYSAAHVTVEFIGDPGENPGTNPGGYELRLVQDSAVPEPGSVCLLGIGCALLFRRRNELGIAVRARQTAEGEPPPAVI